MKIRDIITKIANREDVPKRIKWRNKIWIYNDEDQDYTNDDDDALLAYNFCNHTILGFINDEVEIIEEEKEIEPLAKLGNYKVNTGDDFLDRVLTNINERINHLIDKQTEIIDAVNEIRKEK